MSYSDITDQQNEIQSETLRQALDYDNTGSLTDAEVIARFEAIRNESDSEIDASLSTGGYTTPVTTPAASLVMLRSWSKSITAYKVFKLTEIMPDVRQREFERVMRLLEKVSQGHFKLPGNETEISGAELGMGMTIITSNRFAV